MAHGDWTHPLKALDFNLQCGQEANMNLVIIVITTRYSHLEYAVEKCLGSK